VFPLNHCAGAIEIEATFTKAAQAAAKLMLTMSEKVTEPSENMRLCDQTT